MTDKHLSDADIQQYVLDKSNCDAEIIAHVHSCEYCDAKTETYQLLFSEIKQEPKPVFDFDVSELIIAQLPSEKAQVSKRYPVGYLIACFLAVAVLITGYLNKTLLHVLFKKYVLNISLGILKLSLYLVVTTALAILIFQSVDLYKKYQQKADDLNFY